VDDEVDQDDQEGEERDVGRVARELQDHEEKGQEELPAASAFQEVVRERQDERQAEVDPEIADEVVHPERGADRGGGDEEARRQGGVVAPREGPDSDQQDHLVDEEAGVEDGQVIRPGGHAAQEEDRVLEEPALAVGPSSW
jgi:hypothetical protein